MSPQGHPRTATAVCRQHGHDGDQRPRSGTAVVQDRPEDDQDQGEEDGREFRSVTEQSPTDGSENDESQRLIGYEQQRLWVAAAPTPVPPPVGPHSASSPCSGGIHTWCSATASRR
ncbi:hypothetical protein Acsp01_80240 [Actinoplanes sp. NBRC 101535]|nr:hypothetical protein Acsp01_80240 [Actinoplanes sp. NBRC 101535]